MKYKNRPTGMCEVCRTKLATQYGHKYLQTDRAIKNYGKLLDEPFNLLKMCDKCPSIRASSMESVIWREDDFRRVAERKGYALPNKLNSYYLKGHHNRVI
jgi:hypothetical protein